MQAWYYQLEDKQFGPITQEELVNTIESGELTKDTLVKNNEMDIWVKASSINGLLSTIEELEEQTKRLPVWDTIHKASLLIRDNIQTLWKPLLITGILMIALQSFLFPIGIITFWLHKILYGIALVIFTITTHRMVLLGKDSVSTHGLSWSNKEWIFILYTTGIYIFMMVLSMLIAPIFMILVSAGVPYLMFFVMLPLAMIFVRLSILFPAIAIEKKEIDWSWAMAITKNNGWRMVAILLVIPFIVNTMTNYISGISIALNILAETITVFLLIFEITTLSLSFKYLTDFESSEKI